MSTIVNLNGIDELDITATGGTVTASLTSPGVVALTLPSTGSSVNLKTNGTVNSTQTLLNLQQGTNVTLTESGGTVTIASSGGGGSTLLTSWGTQSPVTGNGAYQTLLSYTIPANTIPAGHGIELVFAVEKGAVTAATNFYQVSFGGTALPWNTWTGGYCNAQATCRIFNNPGSTTAQVLTLMPLAMSSPTTSSLIVTGVSTALSANTGLAQTIELQWQGPASLIAQVMQAQLILI